MPAPDWLTDPTYRNVYATLAAAQVPDIPYEAWLDHHFGRAVVSQSYSWFADVPPAYFRPGMANAHARRLFADAARDLEFYHDDQIGAGLWLLVSDDDLHLAHPDVPVEEREACLLAATELFRGLFAARCAPMLSNGAAEAPVLNSACYMWWEYLTHIAWPGDPDFERMRDACFRVMEETLAISHIAVQEAALHGLGHEVRRSDRAYAIIERFLEEIPNLDPGLERYARSALTGCIQ